ncbi:sensor histidine kinase regulating citrate/malate metabolism [Metabacillus crassostreae]|uniref:sensor histidine kinase n=1 Tax=Metabacillus crassostreae TaxID=929098 RepID=UPI001956FB0A|nr:Spo0B domain-containing protein [Metabacillus crassostreae]MBM7605422.1 sensor histidine kinase regulating citrate/malate metabolism [Metabacillus crassostreae]
MRWLNIKQLKQKRFVVIISVTILIITVLSSLNLYITYSNTKKTIELTIASQATSTAHAVLNNFNTSIYEEYLQNQDSITNRLNLEKELERAKSQTDAVYVYILKKDNQNQPILLADGFPRLDLTTLDDCCKFYKIPNKEFTEKTPFTSRVNDGDNETYIMSGVPINGSKGQVIGSLVVEIGVAKVKQITDEVLNNSWTFFLFSSCFVFFAFSIFIAFQIWYRKEVTSQVGEAEETYQGEFQSMLQTMRSIRHDFINHIQVIQGLLKIGREDRAFEYVNSLSKEVETMELPIKIKHPALYILLQTKWARAQNDKVDMHLLIDDHQFSKIKSIDLIKIFSNLIDNAFDATFSLPELDRFISVEATVTPTAYIFKVENIGPTISEDQLTKIFQVGFSTKTERNGIPRGDGLSIVKQVVNKYSGQISVQSQKNTTCFIVQIPVKS